MTSRAEYQRGMMDACSDARKPIIVIMTSTQIGKTEIINNVVGYHVEHDPAPMLVLMPTVELGESYSKDRLAPMLRDTPTLADKVKDPRSRDSGNTVLHKVFAGGHITIVGSNSPAGLAARPIRILLCDEIDRYPASAGTEGDPISLARRRTANFWNRRIVLTSTPTTAGISRIEKEWALSDQRRYFVPCPHCGASQHLRWAQVKWPEGQPAGAKYHCEACAKPWTEGERRVAIRWGRWQATAAGNGITAGFHLNEIYSPWAMLADMALSFLEAKSHPEKLKAWINTVLGELWNSDAEKIDPHSIAHRGEDFALAPAWAMFMTAGVDIQDDRIEHTRLAWGLGEQAAVWHRTIFGDPSTPEPWRQLDDELLLARFPTEDGRLLPISAACIDTGGHHTLTAYAFCKPRYKRRVYAIKGVGGQGRAVWPRKASKNNAGKVNLFLVGVDAVKETIMSRLRLEGPQPGYIHFSAELDAAYYQQLTAERIERKYVKGFPQNVWTKEPHARNEALDCMVYAFAALAALNVNWARLRAGHRALPEPPAGEPVAAPPANPPPAAEPPPRPLAPPAPGELPRPRPQLAGRRRRRRMRVISRPLGG